MTMICLLVAMTAAAQPRYGGRMGRMQARSLFDGYWLSRSYFGFRIGPAFSHVNSDDQYLDGGSMQTGLNIGFVAGTQLHPAAPLYIESGLSYVEKGGKGNTLGNKFTYDMNYLEVPLVLKYKHYLQNGFTVQPFLGGYLGVGVGGKIKNFGERVAFSSFSEDAFRRVDAGIKLGCGVAFNMFYLDLGYDWGLANVSNDYFDSAHTGCLYLTFGFDF